MFKRKRKKQKNNKSSPFRENIGIVPGNAQHIGDREEQEDAFGFSDIEDPDILETCGVLAALADGMGGLFKGKEASTFAVRTMIETFTNKSLNEPIVDALKRSLLISNNEVLNIAQKLKIEGQVGTTFLGVVIFKDKLHWISVGDSRLYHYRNGSLKQLTTDHIYAKELQEEVAARKMTEDEALNHPQREFLTSYLGIPELKDMNLNEEPYILEPNDLVVLCSDGLYKTLVSEEITEVLKSHCLNPQEACEALVDKVIKKGQKYQDNVTIAILQYIKAK